MLVANSKRFLKNTHLLEMKEKMTELLHPKVGTVSDLEIYIMADGIGWRE